MNLFVFKSLAWKISSNWSFRRIVGFDLESPQTSEHCNNTNVAPYFDNDNFILCYFAPSCNLSLDNSMSKVWEKKVNDKKWIFFNEMGKIIMQFDVFCCRLNNFCNFRVFLAQKEKHPKMIVLTKLKKKKCFRDSTTYFKYHIYHSFSMNFIIVLVCFVVRNVLSHFLMFN